MANRHAILIAVGSYGDPGFPQLKYAESDARDIRAALEPHGFAPDHSDLLLGAGASKAAVEAAVRTRCARLKPADTLVFSYAGHAFHRQGRTYLTCGDTRIAALAETSVGLAWILEAIRKTGCGSAFLFLDPCHEGWPGEDGAEGVEPGIAEAELQGARMAVFVSCGKDEKSLSGSALKRGIWNHHLIEALRGSAPEALEKGHKLTDASLQEYLARSVPKTARTLLTGTGTQTPRAWGGASRPSVLLDFKRIFAARAEAESSDLKSLEHAFFRGGSTESVKRLSGWKKGFRIPDTASLSSTSFIQSVGTEGLRARFDSFHDRIRKNLGYKRSEMVSGEGQGSFSCITPDFTFSISLELDPADPSRYRETLILSEIRNPAIVASPGFGSVFNSEFDEVVLEYSRPFDIGKIIDAIEAMGNPKVAVEYAPDASECTVVFKSLNIRLRFAGKTLAYAFASKAMVNAIMDAIRNAPRILGLDAMH